MKKLLKMLFAFILATTACAQTENNESSEYLEMKMETMALSENERVATIAGGCFWCIEAPFEKVQGVTKVISGYAGGTKSNPTYGEVSGGRTDYREAVQVYFDPEIISYSEVIDIFWKQFDPTDIGGSFGDRGFQYTSAIFYHNENQKEIAERSKKDLDNSGIFYEKIATPVIKFTTFYPAEDYHQDYYKKDPERYQEGMHLL